MPCRHASGSTKSASSSESPSSRGRIAANPMTASPTSATNTPPPSICPRGSSIASGFARRASLSPGFLSDARHWSASRDFLSDTTADRTETCCIGYRDAERPNIGGHETRRLQPRWPAAVRCSVLILPLKPFGFFDSIGCRAGSARTLPALTSENINRCLAAPH